MATPSDITLNSAQCIQKVMHLGFMRVHNVCNNTFVDLPWGLGGWFGGSLIAAILVMMVGLLLALTVHCIREGF